MAELRLDQVSKTYGGGTGSFEAYATGDLVLGLLSAPEAESEGTHHGHALSTVASTIT